MRLNFFLIILTAAIAGCAAPQVVEQNACWSNSILLDAHFESGNLGRCVILEDGSFELTLFPEDEPPINVSPWYAFRLSGQQGSHAVVHMHFEDGFARYWPKISRDHESWDRLSTEQVQVLEDGVSMQLQVTLDQAQMWIAGQETLTTAYYDEWINALASTPGVQTRLAGRSVQSRPIYMAETETRKEIIILLGRQHPPEVSGALAMRPFVNTLLDDTQLAREFRERYQLIILPLLNPDGVVAGHWRHNVNGVDLNRDWGPFTQPETKIMRDWLADADSKGLQLRLMLDFHSTNRNVFYTQRDIDVTDPANFTAQWLGAAAQRLPAYNFEREAAETSAQANSKNYFYTRYGIPAITYETGDETDRDQIESSAEVFAEEMMRTLLGAEPPHAVMIGLESKFFRDSVGSLKQ